jgi:hypothetical protein
MFARAIVIDPGYARAYAGLPIAVGFLYQWCEASEDNLREAVSPAAAHWTRSPPKPTPRSVLQNR